MNKKAIFLLFLFILSRLFFINPLGVFFDSPEYLNRFANSNYFLAIISGHMPLHAGYMMLFWPVSYIAKFLNANPSSAVIFAQIIFSTVSIYCFYRTVQILSNKNIGLIAGILFSLTPIYWITNVSIMAESTYVNSFIIALFFIAKYASSKIEQQKFLFAGGLSFILAILTNPLISLWLPFLLSIILFLKKIRLIKSSIFMLISIAIAILINSFFIASASDISFLNGTHQYLFGEDIKLSPNISSPLAIFRFVRNVFVTGLQNNTGIILILSLTSLTKLFEKNRKIFFIASLLIAPSFLTSQWFDSLLFGRHSQIATLGFIFLSAILLEKRKFLFIITIIYLLAVSLPALSILRQPIPYVEMGKYIKTLPKGLLIETHFARPQTEGKYPGETVFVNQPGWNPEKLTGSINNYLSNGKSVFITSQALSDPYGVYSGPYLYPLSLSYARQPELKKLISQYSIRKYSTLKNVNLEIYKITLEKPIGYPNISRLNYNARRIGYFDPIAQLWFLIESASNTQSQNIIKG